MGALRETMDIVPLDDPTYFPPPPVMKATLAQMYEALRRESHVRNFDGISAQAAARLVLLGLAVAFDLEPRPTLAAWCRAACKKLEDSRIAPPEDGSNTPSHKARREPVLGSENDEPASHQEIDAIVERWTRLSDKWTALGEGIANDCLENGLREGGIVRYSEIKEYIESRHKYNTSAVQHGFTSRMLQFVKSGEVIHLNAEGGDIVFVHEKYADDVLKDT